MLTDHGLRPSLPGGFKIEKNRSEEGEVEKFGTSMFLEGSAEPTRPGLLWILGHKGAPVTAGPSLQPLLHPEGRLPLRQETQPGVSGLSRVQPPPPPPTPAGQAKDPEGSAEGFCLQGRRSRQRLI